MGMGFAPTWLRQVSPSASQNHFNHWRQTTDRRQRRIIASLYATYPRGEGVVNLRRRGEKHNRAT